MVSVLCLIGILLLEPFTNLISGQSAKLTLEERTAKLEPLLSNKWSLVEGRDAINKEFLFKNFNEVSWNFLKLVFRCFWYLDRMIIC